MSFTGLYTIIALAFVSIPSPTGLICLLTAFFSLCTPTMLVPWEVSCSRSSGRVFFFSAFKRASRSARISGFQYPSSCTYLYPIDGLAENPILTTLGSKREPNL